MRSTYSLSSALVLVRRVACMALLVLAMASAGCAGRGRGAGPDGVDGLGGAGASGLGESGMAPGGSLDRARRGLPPEEDGILQDVHFDVDSYTLNSEGRSVLERNAGWLKANGKASVEIEGHADDRGTIEYNLALGARRAKAVRDYLTVLGIDATRVSTISYGEELPVCRESTDACWQRNRRAHLVVLAPS